MVPALTTVKKRSTISFSRAFASGASPRRSMRSANNSRSPRPTGFPINLKALEKKGYIRRVGKRAIEVLNALGKSVLTATRDVPVLGKVPAGKPLLSEENVEGVLTIPADMSSGEKTFALRVKGDSMIGAGIMDGDRGIVKQQ